MLGKNNLFLTRRSQDPKTPRHAMLGGAGDVGEGDVEEIEEAETNKLGRCIVNHMVNDLPTAKGRGLTTATPCCVLVRYI